MTQAQKKQESNSYDVVLVGGPDRPMCYVAGIVGFLSGIKEFFLRIRFFRRRFSPDRRI